ncbi:MAG: acetyltransferase [Desulfitobacterium hafniense]|nr:acetyltransferase [Desulfitobacterium hafniense]
MKDIVIIGAGGFAREVAWLIEGINRKESQWKLLGFIDENKENRGKVLNGAKVLGDFSWFTTINKEIYAVCAVGNPKIKEQLVNKTNEAGVKFATLIHPDAVISNYSEIGEGTIICVGNIVTTNIIIGNHVILNLDCTVGHDAVIDDYCTIAPSVNISGNVKLNKGVDVGTGSAIIQGIEIGEYSIIGAGSVVVRSIPARCTVVGSPAKPIKFHSENESAL